MHAAATQARQSGTTASLRTRLRGSDGGWLCIHVTPIEGDTGAVVVLVDRAKSGDLVPLMLEANDLTDREKEVALLLAQGRAFKQIAAELVLSIHTISDHVKAIYQKVGVSSRGELVAALFDSHVFIHPDVVRLPAAQQPV